MKATPDVKSKLVKFSNNEGIEAGRVELTILYGLNRVAVEKNINDIGGVLEDLGYGFGIVDIAMSNIEKLAAIALIEYIEFPKTLYISFAPSNTAACVQQVSEEYGLAGEGILIGFIDTGIDYMHPAFMDQAGNTRIDYIYDFILGGRSFNINDINRAIKSKNHLVIVPQQDQVGHGTHVASLVAEEKLIKDISE